MKAAWLYVLMAGLMFTVQPLCAASSDAVACSNEKTANGCNVSGGCLDSGSTDTLVAVLVVGAVVLTVVAAAAGLCYIIDHSHGRSHESEKYSQGEEIPDADLLPTRAALAPAGSGA